MRKSWPLVLVVIVVGGLAGAAIAGRPAARDPFVIDATNSDIVDDTTVTTPAAPIPTTTTIVPTTIAPTTIAPTTIAPVVTTATPTTSQNPTTTAPTATTVAPTTTVAGPLPRNEVRLEIANGDGRFRLATITGDRLRPLGYVIDLGDALVPVDATILYFRPGFQDEAEVAANDIGVPNATITAYPTGSVQPITGSDDRGDIIIVLGPDAPR